MATKAENVEITYMGRTTTLAQLQKPKPSDYGYEYGDHETEAGWMLEGGEEAYYAEMEEWQKGEEEIPPQAQPLPKGAPLTFYQEATNKFLSAKKE
jgi:hypothetical protein